MEELKMKETVAGLKRSGLFSNLELLQILKMLTGYKRGVRLLYSAKKDFQKVVRVLKKYHIPYQSDGFEIGSMPCDRGKGGWTNLIKEHGKKHRAYSLYLGRDLRATAYAADAERQHDDRRFGEALSYPECCGKFFDAKFPCAAEIQGDLFPFVFQNTAEKNLELPFLLNTLWYFDAGFIEYWPCSFRCREALRDAAIAYMLLRKFLPDIAAKMKKILKAPVIYTEYSGVFILSGAKYDADAAILTYSPHKILKTADTSLYRLLLQGNRLLFKHGHCFIYRDDVIIHRIRNKGFCFARFSEDIQSKVGKLELQLRRLDVLGLNIPHTTAVEAAMLCAGKKRALRLLVEPEELDAARDLADILGVQYYLSPFRAVTVQQRTTGDRYVNYIKTDAPEAQYLICYAKDVETAKRCADLEAGRNNDESAGLDELLSYPECCVSSFTTRRPHSDWLMPFLKKTPISVWYPCCTNRLGYLFSGKMLLYDYEPCSAFCSGSMRLGKEIRDVFISNGLEVMWARMVAETSVPVLLLDGLLVRMPEYAISKQADGHIDLSYDAGAFELCDYDLRPEAEDSMLWESDHLILNGLKMEFFKGSRSLGSMKQSRCSNRLFLFKEIYDETEM